jgi:hypothetical protein
MPEIYRRNESRASDPDAAPSPPAKVNPAEAVVLIGFALSQLGTRNAHHEFEHLCRELTRRRICPNILPATGPVSGGGDQGADFESYKVGTAANSDSVTSSFFSRSVPDKWLFACSLESNYKKKINEDLQSAKRFGEPVVRVVFFHHLPIKVSARNRLKRDSKEKFQLELEIFDGPAISEMLADRETSWIAKRYLSLPSEFVIDNGAVSPTWFAEVLARNYTSDRLTSAEFFDLKDAVRYATWRSEHHSDLAELLRKMQIFRGHGFRGIQRKVIYETFVASLRGLRTTAGLEGSLEEYFSEIGSLVEPAEIEDGAVLIGYALAANRDNLLNVPLPQLRAWHEQLTRRVLQLKDESSGVATKCSYLFVEGYLAFNKYLTTDSDTREDVLTAFRTGAQAAMRPWHELARSAPDAPLFPIERVARLVNELLVPVEGIRGLDQMVRKIDALCLRRSGQERIAEHHRERAVALLKAGQNLRALDELHAAHSGSFTAGKGFDAAITCWHLSNLYAEMGLHFAAKYYGLAATFASLNLPDDRLQKFAYGGCAEAASADHASGGSLMYFMSARLFALLTSEYSMGGSEETRSSEWARINFYALILSWGSGLIFERLQKLVTSEILPRLGLSEMYAEAKPMLEEFFSTLSDPPALAATAISQGIAPPFSDVGGYRRAAWRQLGTDWHLKWETSYETERQAEALAAYLQIMLADFARTELSIIPGEVFVTLRVHEGKLEIHDIPDNTRVSRLVHLPSSGDQTNLPSTAEVVALVLLRTVSALSDEEFRQRCEARLSAGLRGRLSVYRPSELLFTEFYSNEAYAELYNIGRSSFVEMPDHVIQTWGGLDGPQGTHPRYDKTEFLTLVKNRYKNLAPVIRMTLPRLLMDEAFRQTVLKLRAEGWKDWHILMAVASVRFNYLLNSVPENRSIFDRRDRDGLSQLHSRPEDDSDPTIPATAFSEEDLRRSLALSQMSTLKGLGLEVPQETPNLKGVDKLLRRLHYWEDDVAHDDPFDGLSVHH